jgi:hypothetical protein
MKAKRVLATCCALLFAVTACSPTPTPTATNTPLPPTAIPLYQQVTLTSTDFNESSETPLYTVKGQVPALSGSDDPRVQAFNMSATQVVQQAVDEFTTNVASWPPSPVPGYGSGLEARYTLVSPPGNILSLKFEFVTYMDGAAHPNSFTKTLTFDLERGREVVLDQLFLPGSAYLQAIANYCTAQLQGRDIGFEEMSAQGAAPLPENYQNWNITADGLLITFEEYQVAAYAAGPQIVYVPYAELSALIDPLGPLGGYAP